MSELISIIMSVYNETDSVLALSVDSILSQSYSNFEFIIVDDNPNNTQIREFLKRQSDPRIVRIYNKENRGLVYSLNKALKVAKGSIIARMDADDISEKDRIEKEYRYLKNHNLDLVGTWIHLIDSQNNKIGELKFPITSKGINQHIKLGGCIAHPSWMGKREVFVELNGYRSIPYCEDYDFLLRAIKAGFRMGNVPMFGLQYRIRKEGISLSNQNKQLTMRRYLARNRKKEEKIRMDSIEDFLMSDKFQKEVAKLNDYENVKKNFKNKEFNASVHLICNKNFYIYLYEKLMSMLYKKLYK